jgi:hypothetical protein
MISSHQHGDRPPGVPPLCQVQLDCSQIGNILDQVFPESDSFLIKHLLPETPNNQIEYPVFSQNTNYQQSLQDLSRAMKKNLVFLKKNCYDVNWLNEWVELQETQPEIEDSTSESGNKEGKQARKRRCPGKDDDLLTCPFEGCEKTYLSKTSLRLHIRRLHKPDSVLKENTDLEIPRFSPVLRGVKLERVFKKEDFEKLNYKKSACQNEEVNSTKKVHHASDENK